MDPKVAKLGRKKPNLYLEDFRGFVCCLGNFFEIKTNERHHKHSFDIPFINIKQKKCQKRTKKSKMVVFKAQFWLFLSPFGSIGHLRFITVQY